MDNLIKNIISKEQLGELVTKCAGETIGKNGEFIESTILEQLASTEHGADGKTSLEEFVGAIIRSTIEISVPLGAMTAIKVLEEAGLKVFD